MSDYKIHPGDFLAWLDEYNPDESGYFNAVMGDPPYALIENSKRFKNPDSAAPDPSYAGGAYTRQAKGFMGETWDGFKSLKHYQEWVTSWAVKLQRVCYPGAVVAMFGGSRTFHRLAVGLEDAGLEVFDCIMWVYGSGMPKSLNIGRAIDKRSGMVAGKKRRVKLDGKESNSTRPGTSVAHNDFGDKDLTYLNFMTPEGRRWGGHGTLLKPAYEPLILARIPRGKRSFIDLATQFQTGALNIQAARIVTAAGYDEAGRFPSNVLLSHSLGCKFVGYETLQNRKPSAELVTQGQSELYNPRQYIQSIQRPTDGDGMERREVWQCAPGCPVAQMDEQSGMSERQDQREKKPSGSRQMDGWGFSDDYQAPNYSDSGGASRFFYTGKASTQERMLPGYLSPRKDLKPAARAKCLELMAARDIAPMFGSKDIFEKRWVPLEKRYLFEPSRATHPTVKPIDLVTYVAKLLLPPEPLPSKPQTCPNCGGTGIRDLEGREADCELCAFSPGMVTLAPELRRLLIPFSGVGSEMIGAHFAGWDVIQGVELTANYIPQALDRLRFWTKHPTYESAISGYNQKKESVKTDGKQRAAEEKAGVRRLPLFPDLEPP